MTKTKSLKDLLESLDVLKEWAERSVSQPCLYGLKQKIDKAYNNLKDYIKNSDYKKNGDNKV